MSFIQLFQVDTVAKCSDFLLVLDHYSVRELVRSVLNVGKGLLSTLPIVEVDLELA